MSEQNQDNSINSIQNRTLYEIVPDTPIDSIKKTATIPSVLNRNKLKCINTAPITITNFIGGAAGQTIQLLGEGQTTITNNTTIKTNTGAAKLLAANKVYTFTLFGAVWYENS